MQDTGSKERQDRKKTHTQTHILAMLLSDRAMLF